MKCVPFIICAFVSINCLAQSITGESWETVKKNGKGTLTIVYANDFYLTQNQAGEASGPTIDVVKDFVGFVKKKYKADVAIKFSAAQDLRAALASLSTSSNGVICGNFLFHNPERAKTLKFSSSLGKAYDVFITQNKVPVLTAASDFEKKFSGFKAYAIQSSTQFIELEELKKKYLPSMTILPAINQEEVLKKILDDPKGMGYVSLFEFLNEIKRKVPVQRHPVLDTKGSDLHLVFPKSTDWDVVFNEFLNADGGYVASKSYSEILTRAFGAGSSTYIRKGAK